MTLDKRCSRCFGNDSEYKVFVDRRDMNPGLLGRDYSYHTHAYTHVYAHVYASKVNLFRKALSLYDQFL